MKTFRRLFPVLMVLFVFFAGCASSGNSEIRKAIDEELGQLKKLDSGFQDASSLFFKDFDYKILSVDVDKEKKNADASVRITTLDAGDLARDYKSALLETEIQKAAASSSGGTVSSSEKDRLLYDLLSKNSYNTIRNTTDISLSQKDGQWTLNRTESLRDILSGGLYSGLEDPDLLSPSETLDIYLRSIKNMDASQLTNYLGVDSITATDSESKKAIAQALLLQMQQHFDYEITDTSWKGRTAVVTAGITTFDSDAILDAYQTDMDAYLSSPDAVIDGAEKRTAIAQEKLLGYITDNTSTLTSEADFEMENDGTGWRLIHPGEDLGNALFGSLISVPEGS